MSKKTFIPLDWGIHNQLIILNQERGKYYEAFWGFDPLSADEKKIYVRRYLKNYDEFRFIVHASESEKSTITIFDDALKANSFRVHLEQEIKAQNKPIYRIYSIKPTSINE